MVATERVSPFEKRKPSPATRALLESVPVTRTKPDEEGLEGEEQVSEEVDVGGGSGRPEEKMPGGRPRRPGWEWA